MSTNKIMLLPGLDGTGKLFGPLLRVLANKRVVTVIQYPNNKILTYDELVDYVGEKINTESSIYIVAESFSGPIALKLISKYKDKIKGVILVASFISPPRKLLLSLSRLMPVKLLLKYELPEFLIRRFCLGNDVSNEVMKAFKKVIKQVSPDVLLFRLSEIAKLNINSFARISADNIFYIKASNDKLIKNESLIDIRRVLTINLTVVCGPHFLLQAKPVECSELILKFTSSK